MNILYFTAGAAGMYCGSCLRDNALASELIRQGHNVTLLPLYTPTLTDEPNVSSEKVLFGGISVYLEQHSAIFRHTPAWLDKLWDSKFALNAAAKSSITVDPGALGELTISMLKGDHGNQKKEVAKLLEWLRHVPKPDVVDLQNSMLSGLAKPIKEELGRPVLCTLQGEDLFISHLHEPYRTQALNLIRENAEYIDAFIAVSDFYADYMADYIKIPRHKIHVVPLGINLDDYHPKLAKQAKQEKPAKDHNDLADDDHSEVFRIGYFARVAPEKGLHLLAEAYRILRNREDFGPARLDAAGYLPSENHLYLQQIEQEMKDAGLGDEFKYHGSLDREHKLNFYQNIDLLSMPATYPEPKGLPVLEAMASGVPVVQPRWGSFPEIIDRTGGGVLCEPNDSQSLADEIYALWKNIELTRDLGRKGSEKVREHYSITGMASGVAEVYRTYADVK
ncbi:MAG: glycosyltransferase family 4 protein [Acidobacteria bacterium]|nr:glycosyltransferase family 4 protein [Acidobacteriota bacterium]